MKSDVYGADYYFYGVESGKSCYQNYRWIPELTMPLAMTMIDLLRIEKHNTILDFGCALGYLVKAFRLLHRQAWGIDISEFAIENTDLSVRQYCSCSLPATPEVFDFCIAKDVFEHVPANNLKKLLEEIPAQTMFAIMPLGKEGNYTAPSNNMDVTHCICEDIYWWENLFINAGWFVQNKGYKVSGIKEQYYKNHPHAHGFFFLEKI